MSTVMSINNEYDSNQAFFFENIRSDNNETRLSAIHSLRSVAERLGPQQTKTTIYPLLIELTKEVDEDVRTAFLEQLKNFISLLGGVSEIPKFLEIIEIFLASDEQLVRNKAVEVMVETSESLSPEQISEFIVPFVVKLFENEWFTARLSALVLFPIAYRSNDPNMREKLLNLVLKLADDKIMSVRRLFVINVPILFETLTPELFMKHVFPHSIDFFNDPLDTIKMSTIDSFVSVLPHVMKYPNEYSLILSALRSLVQDKSWRVRYTLVLKYPDIKSMIDDSKMTHLLLEDIDVMLDDREPEVRVAAASIISKMFKDGDNSHVDGFFTQKMWNRIETLANNTETDVGPTIVEQIGQISPLFGENQYKNFFIPFLEKILRSSNPDVKLKGLSILSCVRSEFNVLQANLVEGLKDMSTNSLWRIRLSLVEHISAISSSIMIENTESDWTEWCKEMLQDEANAVREGTVGTVIELMKKLDDEWCLKFIQDRIDFYSKCDNYLLRITTIYLLKRMCHESKSVSVRELILSKFIQFLSDKVANVRLNIVRAFGELKSCVQESKCRDEILSNLKIISESDTDPDVVYFCREALKCYSSS